MGKKSKQATISSLCIRPPKASVFDTASLIDQKHTMGLGLHSNQFLRTTLSFLGSDFSYAAMWQQRVFDFWSARFMVAICLNYPDSDPVKQEILDRWNYIRSGIIVFRCNYGDHARINQIANMMCRVKSTDDRKDIIRYNQFRHTRIPAEFAMPLWEEARVFLDPSRMGTQQPPPR